MKKLSRNICGAAAVEFALVALPIMIFIVGIMQTAWIVWIDNLLQTSVNVAARCGALNSTTSPCAGSNTTNMITAANRVFSPLPLVAGTSVSFTNNTTNCVGTGLTGTYIVRLFLVTSMTLTARSCYPTIPLPP